MSVRAVVASGGSASVGTVDLGAPGRSELLVDVSHSSVNYKDGLAVRGDRGVARIDPLVPGIDVVGTVVARGPGVDRVAVGDRVVLCGAGSGEDRHGGWAERAIVPADAVVVLPDTVSAAHAAAIGTAGYTAMLSVLALERTVSPDDGPVLVTGASGGVGTVAIALLAVRGYTVTASTGRPENADSLRRLGASEIIDRRTLAAPGRPMQRETWAGAVDAVGGDTLANVLAMTRYGGAVTACGLAQDVALPTTVLPFILRSVALLGIDSVHAPLALRQRAWDRIATDLDPALLDTVTTTVPLAEAPDVALAVVAGTVHGRTVVDTRR